MFLRLPGDRWALIDCYLPEGRVRTQFFDFVTRRDITRLDFLCLTHPHRDHFHGMIDVVDYFTRDGRSIGTYCDSGVDPVQVLHLLRAENRPSEEVSEYENLHRCLGRLIKSSAVRYYRVDENTRPIRVGGYGDMVRLIPLAPAPGLIREMTRGAVASGAVRGSVNRISLVLLLRLTSGHDAFAMLLAGDADGDALDRALRIYGAEPASGGDRGIDAIKVSHHGSAKSHSPSIPEARRTNRESVAAISVGAKFRVLPDREVMREYIEGGWVVLLTTKRTKPWRKRSALASAGRGSPESNDLQLRDIRIAWGPDDGLVWGPPEARVDPSELRLYDSASGPAERVSASPHA